MNFRYCARALVQDTPYVRDGVLTARGVEVYTEGECWLLAWQLQQMTGFEPVVIAGEEPAFWLHVLVKTPEGMYLDATGLNTIEAICAEWKIGPDRLYGFDALIGAGYASLDDFLARESGVHLQEVDPEMLLRTREVAQVLMTKIGSSA